MTDKTSDGAPAFPQCSRCDLSAVIRQGHQWLCAKHYRFGQMRSRARSDGKSVPTHEQLESMLADTCPECSVVMTLRMHDGAAGHTATLQHYRDGSLAIVCLSCNTRHASMPGDTFRDMPKDHKRCPSCEQSKPATEFTADNSRTGTLRRKSKCRTCSNAQVKQWKELNRDRYNEYQRQYRARRKPQGGSVFGGA